MYDKYLALAQPAESGIEAGAIGEILSRKTALTGEPGAKDDYFDEKIRAATSDRERFEWYRRKADAVDATERTKIEEEMIAQFLHSDEEGIAGQVARLLFRKVLFTPDPAEKSRLCDLLIERYQNASDRQAQSCAIRAFVAKASLIDDEAGKLKLYDTVIERYKSIDDFWVKDAVDAAIAARFRLLNRGGGGK